MCSHVLMLPQNHIDHHHSYILAVLSSCFIIGKCLGSSVSIVCAGTGTFNIPFVGKPDQYASVDTYNITTYIFGYSEQHMLFCKCKIVQGTWSLSA